VIFAARSRSIALCKNLKKDREKVSSFLLIRGEPSLKKKGLRHLLACSGGKSSFRYFGGKRKKSRDAGRKEHRPG